jgi:hypothetical protein
LTHDTHIKARAFTTKQKDTTMKRKKIVEVKDIARLPEHVVNRVAAGEVRDDDSRLSIREK